MNKGQEHHGHACCGHGHKPVEGGFDVELICAGLAGVCIAVAWLGSYFAFIPHSGSLALYVLAYVLTGWFTVRTALTHVWAGRFEVDSLMLFAAAGAAYLANGPKGRCCCSSSASDTRLKATRWAAPDAPSKRYRVWLHLPPPSDAKVSGSKFQPKLSKLAKSSPSNLMSASPPMASSSKAQVA